MKKSDSEKSQDSSDAVEQAAVYVSIDRLKPWKRNPRKNAQAVPAVARSIEELGFAAPILARLENGEIIAGHTRYLAAKELIKAGKLDPSRIPVRFLDVSEEDAHKLALADNKLGEIAEWDEKELLALLGDLRQQDSDAAAVAGWTDGDIDKLLEEAAADVLDADEDDGGKDGLGNKVISYNIIFDDDSQQECWFEFLKHLKGLYPHAETVGERLAMHINESGA